jgi:hypothetical protein
MSLTSEIPEGLRRVNLKGCRAGDGRPFDGTALFMSLSLPTAAARRCRQLERMLAFDTLFSCQGARVTRARVRKRASHCSTSARPRSKTAALVRRRDLHPGSSALREQVGAGPVRGMPVLPM